MKLSMVSLTTIKVGSMQPPVSSFIFVGSVQPPVSSFIFSVDMPYRVDMIVYLHLQIVKSHLRTSMNNKSGI